MQTPQPLPRLNDVPARIQVDKEILEQRLLGNKPVKAVLFFKERIWIELGKASEGTDPERLSKSRCSSLREENPESEGKVVLREAEVIDLSQVVS